MPSSSPFVDQETGRIDRSRVLAEAIPLTELVGLVGVAALVPFAFVILLGPTGFSTVLTLLSQFILAVGSGVILIYVISRAIRLAGE